MSNIREKLKDATDYEKYVVARWCYALGVDYLEDAEYTVLHESLKHDNATDLVYKSWSSDTCPVDILKKYGLDELIRQDFVTVGVAESIPNCSNDGSLNEVLKSAKSMKQCRMSYKLDGWNVQCHFIDGKFSNAHTRGRASRPIDVELMKHLTHDIHFNGHVVISGELLIPNDKWEEYKSRSGNVSQRNSVSSLIANNDYEYAKWVCYKIDGDTIPSGNKYDILKQAGYEVPDYIEFDGTGLGVQDIKEKLKGFDCNTYKYPTDGVVFECESFQIALRLLNYSEKVLIGEIVGYKEEFGAHGTSFQIEIRPLDVAGITRRYIPIQNLGNIEDYNLRVGMPICFNIRSAVAPVFNQPAQAKLVAELRKSGIMKDDYTVEKSYFDNIYNNKQTGDSLDITYESEVTQNNAPAEEDMMKLLNSEDIISFD